MVDPKMYHLIIEIMVIQSSLIRMGLIKNWMVNKFVQLINWKYLFRMKKNMQCLNLTFGFLIHPRYIEVFYEPDE